MVGIAPNSVVNILKGVPLDRGYNHTLYCSSASSQLTAFIAYRKYSLNSQTYQRAGKGKIRVAILADNLYDCNYMVFQNTNYGSKWFYAFIDRVEYINDNASEIYYTIDVMQTWYFDYELGSCYVEREHTLTDVAGENLVPENIDTGDLIPMQKGSFTYPDDITSGSGLMYGCVVFYIPNNTEKYVSGHTESSGIYTYTLTACKNSDGTFNTGSLVNGIYSGCTYYCIPMKVSTDTEVANTRKNITALIDTIIGTSVGGTIANVCQVPYDLWLDWVNDRRHGALRYKTIDQTAGFYNPTHTSFYTPRNKKMYCSPYRSMVVSNNAGQTATYNWEYFNYSSSAGLKSAHFNIYGTPIMQPEIMCYPTNYRGITTDYESGVTLNDFPTPPWSEDSFAEWWTQNRNSYVTSLVTSAIVTIGAIIATVVSMGSAAPAAGSAIAAEAGSAAWSSTTTATTIAMGTSSSSKIWGSIGTYKNAKSTPDQISGQSSISSMRTMQNRIGFYFYDMGVEKEKAKVIDDYFNMFGYAVKQTKIPNIRQSGVTLRPHWNYIKTSACIIHSASGKGLPAEDEEMISKIYDNGITFWNNADEIGDYSLDNSPT